MSKKFLHIVCSLILLANGAMAQGGGKTYFLKFNMAKGQGFTYRIGMDMNMNQTVMGQEVHVNTRFGMNGKYLVVGDSSGWKKVEALFDRVLIHVNANGQGVDIDTDSATSFDGPMGSAFKGMKAIVGQKFYYTVNEKGEVGQVYGLKEIGERVKANAGDAGFAEGMTQSLNEESFRQNLEQAYKYYPKKPVAIGESWNSTMTITSNGIPMTTDGTYTLQAVDGDIATIKVVGKMTSAEGASVEGMNITMSGTFTGESKFELSTGLPMSSTVDMKTDMKMNMQGQEIPLKMDITLNSSGKKI